MDERLKGNRHRRRRVLSGLEHEGPIIIGLAFERYRFATECGRPDDRRLAALALRGSYLSH